MSAAELQIPAELTRRRAQTEQKLLLIADQFEIVDLGEHSHPCVAIIATGSLGRSELGSRSDLDLFLIDTADGDAQLGNLDSIQLRAKLIQVAAAAGFETFSNDGEFLIVQHMPQLLRSLGTSQDDSSNAFTARMLLLLESRPLLGQDAYRECVEAAVNVYARDAKPDESFRPQFLINDIVRYWKTLCLNYEAKRHELHDHHAMVAQRGPSADDEAKLAAMRTKLRIARLKLRFNRLWTCFNCLAFVVSGVDDHYVSREHVKRLVSLTPVERAQNIASQFPQTVDVLQQMLELYADFLASTDGEKNVIHGRYADEDTHTAMYEKGRQFGDLMAEVLDAVSEKAGVKRYLLL